MMEHVVIYGLLIVMGGSFLVCGICLSVSHRRHVRLIDDLHSELLRHSSSLRGAVDLRGTIVIESDGRLRADKTIGMGDGDRFSSYVGDRYAVSEVLIMLLKAQGLQLRRTDAAVDVVPVELKEKQEDES